MTSDLRTYLAEVGEDVLHVRQPVNVLTELGALCSQSESPVLFEQVRDYPGWRICDRLLATRELRALALRTTPARWLPETAARLAAAPGESRLVNDGPVKERILLGDDVDLFALPVAISSENDSGRYIGAGMGVTRDPHSGIQNEAYYRTQLLARDRATFAMGRREAWATYQKYEAAGEPMPIAFVIGHHPAYEIAAAHAGPHVGYEEFELAAAFLQEPVEFVRCETCDLRVPAQAEIVIEAVALPHVRRADGPFGEYTGYYGSHPEVNVLEVKAITMRRDAIYRHLNTSHLTDLQVLSTLLGEVRHYTTLQRAAGRTEILDVHLPPWAMFTVLVQMVPRYEGHARSVILAALGTHPLAKVVIAVDDDIDIYSAQDVMWALSCRVNPATDIFTISGMQGFHLDHSTPMLLQVDRVQSSQQVNGVVGIDATKPPVRLPAERARFTRTRPMGDGKVFLQDFL